ncbi:pirin-like C-terminal cupin domain-containing protein [Marinomonas sp.]|uniref:pirin-like C-terminal cupin domain-containing protein n=1 Tax=Marinomonas sp. TaxID=1904862 RepID=UPI003BAA806B
MQAGQSLTLPNTEERAIYVVKGSLKIKDTVIPEFAMVILSAADNVVINATADLRISLIGGEKISKCFIEWNFISSRKERVEQAKRDWQAGTFPKVVGDEDEFIPLP